MSNLLKGNYRMDKQIKNKECDEKPSLEKTFEKEALKKLGGSIAFVAKQKVIWDESEFEPKDKTK